jgi:hypothetical protein
LQSIRGAKFFIPARFLPPQYNYLVDITNDDLESGVETVSLSFIIWWF